MSGRWVDLREAAEVLGLSTEAVRKRASRGSLRSEHHDGRVVVWVDDDRTTGGREAQGEASALLAAKDETISLLKDQLASEREAHGEARRIIAGLVQRVPELEAPREAQEAPQEAEPRSDPSAPTAPTVERETGARRPWWRRVFGG